MIRIKNIQITYLFIFFSCLAVSHTSNAQQSAVEFKKINITTETAKKGKSFTIQDPFMMDLPTSFRNLSDAEAQELMGGYRKPLLAFASENKKAKFVFNDSPTQWQENDYDMLQSFLKASIQNSFSKVEFIKTETVEINGQNYLLLEYYSELQDDKENIIARGSISTYNYTLYKVIKGRIYIFNFTSSFSERATWSKVFKQCGDSIEMRKK